VYDELDSYHVTDMVEFIGILTVDPLLTCYDLTSNGSGQDNAFGFALAEENAAETKAHHPPSSLVPRLHCIIAHKMTHSNPLLPRNLGVAVPLNGKLQIC